MSRTQPTLFPRLAVLAAAGLFSTGSVAVKATALGAWQVAGFRAGVAAAVVALVAGRWGIPRPRIDRRTWLVAVGYAATLTLFVGSAKLTTAAGATFLQATAPLYVLLLSPWLLGESPRRRDLAYMAAMAAGLACFFLGLDPVSATAPDPLAGNLLAALAGLTWALTLLGLRWLAREQREADGSPHAEASVRAAGSALGAVLCGNLVAFAVALPWALPVPAAAPRDLVVVLYLGAFQVALAYLLLTAGMRRVPALEASLLMLLDPVLSPVWTWAAYGERLGPWTVVGGAVILAATALKTWRDAARGGRGPGRG